MLQLLKCTLTANDNIIYINPSHITAIFNSTQKAEFPSVCIVMDGERKYYVKGEMDSFLTFADVVEAGQATAPKKATKTAAKSAAVKSPAAAKKAK